MAGYLEGCGVREILSYRQRLIRKANIVIAHALPEHSVEKGLLTA